MKHTAMWSDSVVAVVIGFVLRTGTPNSNCSISLVHVGLIRFAEGTQKDKGVLTSGA